MSGVESHHRHDVDVRVTGYERTLVNVLDRPDLTGSWEEIWRSLESRKCSRRWMLSSRGMNSMCGTNLLDSAEARLDSAVPSYSHPSPSPDNSGFTVLLK